MNQMNTGTASEAMLGKRVRVRVEPKWAFLNCTVHMFSAAPFFKTDR